MAPTATPGQPRVGAVPVTTGGDGAGGGLTAEGDGAGGDGGGVGATAPTGVATDAAVACITEG